MGHSATTYKALDRLTIVQRANCMGCKISLVLGWVIGKHTGIIPSIVTRQPIEIKGISKVSSRLLLLDHLGVPVIMAGAGDKVEGVKRHINKKVEFNLCAHITHRGWVL